MKKLKIKYCYSEEETNQFLERLFLDELYPRLHSIQYMARVQGDGVEKNYADDNGVTATAQVNSDIIAVVQYFVEE